MALIVWTACALSGCAHPPISMQPEIRAAKVANAAAVADAKEIKQLSDKVDDSVLGAERHLGRADGKAAIILQYLKERRGR